MSVKTVLAEAVVMIIKAIMMMIKVVMIIEVMVTVVISEIEEEKRRWVAPIWIIFVYTYFSIWIVIRRIITRIIRIAVIRSVKIIGTAIGVGHQATTNCH